jgi:hypothetical protein
MPALTCLEVVRALIWLGLRGVSIPDRIIAFALEEDFSKYRESSLYAVACALIHAAEEASILIRSERYLRPPMFQVTATTATP